MQSYQLFVPVPPFLAMSTNVYQPVKRQEKLSVQVADQLQSSILANELKPGDRLPPERVLCDRFDVSRTVIREAISVLEAKGLLTSKGGSGTYVRAIQSGDVADSIGMYISAQSHLASLEDLIEVRRVIEIQIASLAAERATPEDVEELEQIMAAAREAVDDPDAFAVRDLEFHVALARLSKNALFEILLEPLSDALYKVRQLASRLPGVTQEALALHQNILDRIKACDPEGAAREMAKHLEQSRRVTLEGVRKFQK
jgi:GntR family transcriptional repressor for pyruvate dehydrogenase complex